MSSVRSAIFAVACLALGAVGACGGATTRGGSETNWWVTCHEDSDCAAGVCACGICTDVCEIDAQCPGKGTMRCASEGSTAHEQLCVTTRSAPSGLCLAACTGDGQCNGNESCKNGVCAPRTSWKVEHQQAAPLGAPCLPERLEDSEFGGFVPTEAYIETRSAGCESARCLVQNFQGRPGCPYGGPCETTGDAPMTVTRTVLPQIVSRPPADTMTCSCRCDGPPGTGPFCACPEGLECRPLVSNFGAQDPEMLAGSYCLKRGTFVEEPSSLAGEARCDRALRNCEGR